VKASLVAAYASETLTTSAGTAAAEAEDPYTFAQATVELPDATGLVDGESIDLRIDRKAQLHAALGSITPTNFFSGFVDYSAKVTLPMEDATLLKYAYGNSTATSPATTFTETSLDVVFDNAAATTANRQVHLTFGGVYVKTFGTPKTAGEKDVQEVQLGMRYMTLLQAINNTATEPA
jgi:hypothetical protein